MSQTHRAYLHDVRTEMYYTVLQNYVKYRLPESDFIMKVLKLILRVKLY